MSTTSNESAAKLNAIIGDMSASLRQWSKSCDEAIKSLNALVEAARKIKLPPSLVQKFEPDIWQEYDCPVCGMDFDLAEDQILAVGESCSCSGCGGQHIAGLDGGPNETMIRLVADGAIEFRPLPRDAAEKAAWLAEVQRARA